MVASICLLPASGSGEVMIPDSFFLFLSLISLTGLGGLKSIA